jgi:hypothetical protein
MVETIYVRGEGGAIIAMDLPLPEAIAERYESGLLVRVEPDGSPYTPAGTRTQTSPEPDPDANAGASAATADGGEAEAGPAPSRARPGINAPKAEWIAYVVASGLHSAEDAANYTKADLIDMVS